MTCIEMSVSLEKTQDSLFSRELHGWIVPQVGSLASFKGTLKSNNNLRQSESSIYDNI